jgi:hypothetical protein
MDSVWATFLKRYEGKKVKYSRKIMDFGATTNQRPSHKKATHNSATLLIHALA